MLVGQRRQKMSDMSVRSAAVIVSACDTLHLLPSTLIDIQRSKQLSPYTPLQPRCIPIQQPHVHVDRNDPTLRRRIAECLKELNSKDDDDTDNQRRDRRTSDAAPFHRGRYEQRHDRRDFQRDAPRHTDNDRAAISHYRSRSPPSSQHRAYVYSNTRPYRHDEQQYR